MIVVVKIKFKLTNNLKLKLNSNQTQDQSHNVNGNHKNILAQEESTFQFLRGKLVIVGGIVKIYQKERELKKIILIHTTKNYGFWIQM